MILSWILHKTLAKLNRALSAIEPEIARKILKIKDKIELKLNFNEARTLYYLVKMATKLSGVMAEVGVWQGGSASLICEAKGKKKLYLFDAFEYLPKYPKKEDYTYSVEKIKKNLAEYDNVFIIKGLFEDTKKVVQDEIFSFVHIDIDFGQEIFNILNFLYEKMEKSGIILIHDIKSIPEIYCEIEEFLKGKPEKLIEITENQGIIIKI